MKQQRAESTRAELIRSAAELFGRYGYAGTNISDVTRAAGVTKGALYFHFAAKDDLVEAVARQGGLVLDTMEAQAHTEGVAAAQTLIDLTHGMCRESTRNPYVRAGFRLARECGERGRPFHDSYLTWSGIVSGAVAAVGEEGDLAAGVRHETVASGILAISLGAEALLSSGLCRRDEVTDVLATIWRLLLPGLVVGERLVHLLPGGRDRPTTAG